MAIWRKGHEITGIHRKGKTTQEVWKFIDGAWRNVWQFIRSCFGKGWWINKMPWSNTDKWQN